MVDTMTPEEKAGQLFWVRFPETGWDELAREWHPGGFLLFGRDFKNRTPEELRTLLASLQETSPIPLLLGVDEEGGTVVRASYYPAFRAEKFRSPQALFAAGGLEAVRADALDKSAFLLDLGLNVNLAPVCDVSTDPADFIYARAFGQDAQATAEYADTVVSAMGEAGIGSVLYCCSYPQATPTMGSMLGLKAFVAAVLGGIGSIPGAMIGGIAIGLCECFVSAIGLSAWKDAVTFAILIIVLLVKPTGFLGRKVQEKV